MIGRSQSSEQLGGIHAWALANRFPSQVEQVITLGSPLRTMADVSMPAATFPSTLIHETTGWSDCENASIDEGYGREDPLPLGFDPAVAAIADGLGQSRADWQPFRRPGGRRLAFPRPSGLSDELLAPSIPPVAERASAVLAVAMTAGFSRGPPDRASKTPC